jgi:hypothetical protein
MPEGLMMTRAVLLTTMLLALTTTLGWAQNFASPAAAPFRLEWQAASARNGRAVLRGYVYNLHTMRAENVRVRVEQLDGASRAPAPRFTFVTGTIGFGERGYFEVAVPAADANYRVTVESFDRAGCGNG